MLITKEILLKVCYQKKLKNETRAGIIADLLNKVCPLYGINSADILHEFLANVLHESDEFMTYEENLNYRAEALINKFGRHRISIADAWKYGRTGQHSADTRMIANILYGGSWGFTNLGNKNIGDGHAFRGSGPIQLTGRKNFELFAEWMSKKFGIKKTAEEWAEAIRTNDEYAIHSACWLFAISKQLIDEAIDDKLKEIVKKINGGYLGMPERENYYELCKRYII